MNIPNFDKRSFVGVLKKLKISDYPTLPEYLKSIKDKLDRKEALTDAEKLLAFAKFDKYCKEYNNTISTYYYKKFDWDSISHRPLLNFQRTGVEFLINKDYCFLCDEQGLGKSIQSIVATLVYPKEYKILIVTLYGLKYNFLKEVKYFSSDVVVVDKKWQSARYTIVHYEQLSKYKQEIIDLEADIIICDECHKIRNGRKTQRGKAMLDVFTKNKKEIKKIWLLTGTPIDNRPIDYYNLLNIIKHPLAKNKPYYQERYCNGYIDMFGRMNDKGSSNLAELYRLTAPYMLRRLKDDPDIREELKDLPFKERIPVFYELKNKKGYENAYNDYLKEQAKKGKFPESSGMAERMAQRMFCAKQRIADGITFEAIDTELDDGCKVLVFTNFTEIVNSIYEHYGTKICRFIDGSITGEDRIKVQDEFNDNQEIRILVGNIEAMGVGLNLATADRVLHHDLSEKPSAHVQAEDRAFRIGAKKDILSKYLMYDDTIEVKLYDSLLHKTKTTSKILDGKKKDFFEYGKETEIIDEPQEVKEDLLKQIFEKLDKIKIG